MLESRSADPRGLLPRRRLHLRPHRPGRRTRRPLRVRERRAVPVSRVPSRARVPHPTPVEDGYAALSRLIDRAPELGVDPGRIAVMGDSAGVGLAAALTILARERGAP
nr:alpha/beta hydrolase fold domain-containing protein [Jiangella ureilytica]